MTEEYQFFLMAHIPTRVKLDEDNEPCYVESYNIKTDSFYRNNSILEDLYNHHEAIEIDENDFYSKIEDIRQK